MAASSLAASARADDWPVVGTVERLDPALDALVEADTPVHKLMEGYNWAEGPVWVGGPEGYLLSSDARGNAIRRWNASDGGSDWLRPSGWQGAPDPGLGEPGTNGLCLGRGGIVCADSGSRGVAVLDLKTKQKTVLCSHFEGKRFNSPNDVVLGPDGAIYFTDPPYGLKDRAASPLREMDYMGVFRIGTDNTVTVIDRTLAPNGIGLSPDGRTLYATDRDKWLAITLDEKGRPTDKRVLITASEAMRGGDGMRVDSTGHLWCSSKVGICIFSPEGKHLGIIHADDTESNCDFGADGYLYITSHTRLLRVKVKARKLLWPVWRKTFG
jgi:gluconolactonase